ncbi:hypothetical protein LR48_Vigan01g304800 [Vigna angularis]|uniref:Uncharacterized protein n=1 Tax=Phaseolus angularis TaxID=3914 RepID=A0A0L9TSW7_PHAAN|nr:hypothetical protein LR48_Vigan01g304800 [Vigna angularis]
MDYQKVTCHINKRTHQMHPLWIIRRLRWFCNLQIISRMDPCTFEDIESLFLSQEDVTVSTSFDSQTTPFDNLDGTTNLQTHLHHLPPLDKSIRFVENQTIVP